MSLCLLFTKWYFPFYHRYIVWYANQNSIIDPFSHTILLCHYIPFREDQCL